MAAGTLYTYPENFRAYKVLAAANYSGFNLKVDASFQYGTTNRTPEFLAKFPLGKVPAFESSSGVCLNESNAIASFVANDQLLGSTAEAKAKVMQWMNFADQEIMPAVCTWVFPCMGFMQFNKTNTEKAKEEILAVMSVLKSALTAQPFLAGNTITLADISVATTLLLAYEWVMDPAFRSPFEVVNKWFETVTGQPEVKKALPAFKMCAKMAQFDAKKYAEISGGKKKAVSEKKPKAEAPKAEVKADKPPAEPAAPPAEPKKSKNPFDEFPNSDKFIMDEWKKMYSNEDTATVALPWFWEHFDPEKYSIWFGTYKEEYLHYFDAQDFINMNLIGGFMQRLDGLRKNGFGTFIYFSEDGRKTIRALFISKGTVLPFSLSEDLNVDAPSYNWRKLDFHNEADKKTITTYLLYEGDYGDFKEYCDGKVFK